MGEAGLGGQRNASHVSPVGDARATCWIREVEAG